MSESANDMPSTSIEVSDKAQQPAKSKQSLAVTGKNRAAIDAMVWQGLKRSDAAQSAGLTDHALYVALTKPHVKAYYLAQCEVLRLSGKARRIHRLNDMVEQDDNKAAVINAALALERMGDGESTAGSTASRTPGVVIIIEQPRASLMAHERGLDAKPLILQSGVQDDGS